jgi:hypothetical protein
MSRRTRLASASGIISGAFAASPQVDRDIWMESLEGIA